MAIVIEIDINKTLNDTSKSFAGVQLKTAPLKQFIFLIFALILNLLILSNLLDLIMYLSSRINSYEVFNGLLYLTIQLYAEYFNLNILSLKFFLASLSLN